MFKNQRGFSLIEGLIIICILVLIAAIAIPGLQSARKMNSPEHYREMAAQATKALHGEAIKIDEMNHLQQDLKDLLHIKGLTEALEAAGVTPAEIEALKTGKFRVVLDR
jgi:Tfp pilus assembly protein FimT